MSLLAHVFRLQASGLAARQAETHSARRRIPDIAGGVSQGLIVYLDIALKDGFRFVDFALKNKLQRRGAAER